MELKTSKKLIFLFCLFSLSLNEKLEPQKKMTFYGTKEATFSLEIKPAAYFKIIDVLFSPENPEEKNPIVLIGTDRQCQNRLYAGTQLIQLIFS